MFCRNCGKEIDDNVSFCRFCGNTVDYADDYNAQTPVNTGNEGAFAIISFCVLAFALANIIAFFLPIYDHFELTIMDLLEYENEKAIIPLIASALSLGLFGVSFNKKGTGVFTLLISIAIAVLDIMWFNDRSGGIFEGLDFEYFFDMSGMGLKLYLICGIGVPIFGVIKAVMLGRSNR